MAIKDKILQAQKLSAELKKEKEEAQKKAMKGIFYDEKTSSWAFRLAIKDASGKRFDTVRTGFKTAAQAKKGKEELRYEIKHKEPEPIEETTTSTLDLTKTFSEVYAHYKEHRAKEKRPSTLRKQDSIWVHHIEPIFGSKTLAEVSKSDLYNYLLKLYLEGDTYNNFKTGYAYKYVEGFLKFFWLIYGYAYDNNWVESDRYTKDFLNKTTKLSMPNEITEDEDEVEKIQIYTQEEINKIREVMKTGNLYISFLICYHCGLRISECMGLMWSDFDIKNHTLSIRRQLLYDYQDKVFYLGPPKTKKGRRVVQVPNALYDFLLTYKAQQEENAKSLGYKNTEIVYDRNGKDKNEKIIGGDFIQRKENGELITINSVKYWTTKVKSETGIDFHFHALRHTNASMLAARNIPITILSEHLGHANINIAQKYYIASTELAHERLKQALNEIT